MNAEQLEKWIAENEFHLRNDSKTLVLFSEDLRAYLSGMALVPVEPTAAMCKAATSYTHSHDAKLIYKAMLAATKEGPCLNTELK